MSIEQWALFIGEDASHMKITTKQIVELRELIWETIKEQKRMFVTDYYVAVNDGFGLLVLETLVTIVNPAAICYEMPNKNILQSFSNRAMERLKKIENAVTPKRGSVKSPIIDSILKTDDVDIVTYFEGDAPKSEACSTILNMALQAQKLKMSMITNLYENLPPEQKYIKSLEHVSVRRKADSATYSYRIKRRLPNGVIFEEERSGFETQEEAAQARQIRLLQLVDSAKNEGISTIISVDAVFDEFINEVCSDKPELTRKYKSLYKGHIQPHIGAMNIDSVENITTVKTMTETTQMSFSYTNSVKTLLYRLLDYAHNKSYTHIAYSISAPKQWGCASK